MTEEGLIEAKADWYVQKIDFTDESLRRPEVFESLSSWIRERVVKKVRRRPPLENFMKLRLAELTFEEWLILLGGAATCLTIGATIGRHVFG